MECCYNTNPLQFRRYDLCRVKFGVPLDQVCKKDIPGPLLVSWFFFPSSKIFGNCNNVTERKS